MCEMHVEIVFEHNKVANIKTVDLTCFDKRVTNIFNCTYFVCVCKVSYNDPRHPGVQTLAVRSSYNQRHSMPTSVLSQQKLKGLIHILI